MDYLAGVILQYLRSSKRFPEWGTLVVVFAVAALSFWLSPASAGLHDARSFVNGLLPHALTMLGTAQATSSAANVIVSTGVIKESNPLVPVTDSV